MEWHLPALPFDLHPLIAEAKRRARRRRLLLAVLALVLAGVALGMALTAGAGGGRGTIPWLPTRPNLGPANPPLAPACTASQLRATLSLQGATSAGLAGAIEIVNGSSRPCALVGRPKLSFAGATSKWRETRWTRSTNISFDPLAPRARSLRALAPGRHVEVGVFWSNWCGRGSNDLGRPGRPPEAIVLAAPGGGRIALQNRHGGGEGAPPCLSHSISTLSATRYVPYVPQLGPSSQLPLRARILSSAKLAVKAALPQPGLTVRRATWQSFTVVLTNYGRRPFSFGHSCPAYTEQIDAYPAQAYILDCRPVGSIAPRRSVRFAMRIFVPPSLSTMHPASLAWVLAPHTWNAPQAAPVIVEVHR